MADRRSLFIKVSIEDLEKSKEALKSLGADGEKAFRNMERAANDASRKAEESAKGFRGLKTGIEDIDTALGKAEKGFGKFAERLAGGAIGAVVIAALTVAFNELTKETGAAADAHEKLAAAVKIASDELGKIAVTAEQATANNKAVAAARIAEIRVIEGQLQDVLKQMGRFADPEFENVLNPLANTARIARERLKELKTELGALLGLIQQYPDPLIRLAQGKDVFPGFTDTPKSGGVDIRKQHLERIEKLEQEAERRITRSKEEEIEVRHRQELDEYQRLLNKKEITLADFARAETALAQRKQGELDRIAEEGAQKQAEALIKAHEQAAKEAQRVWEKFGDGLGDILADALVNGFRFDRAQIERQIFGLAGGAFKQELLHPLLGGLGLRPVGANDAASPLFNLGRSLSGLSIGGIPLLGSGLSGTAGEQELVARAAQSAGVPLPGGPGLLQQGLTGGATGFGIGSILSNLFPGALNAGNSQIGGSLGGLAGGVAGGLGALGSTLGPFGGIIGGLLGSILGGLFGPKKPSVGPNSTAAILVGEGGALRVVGTGADNGGSVDSALALARGFATALDRLTETLGVRIAPHLNMAGQESGLGRVMGFQAGTFGGQFNLGFWGNEVSGTDAEDVVKRMLFRVLKDPRTGGFEGFSADVAKAIANSAAGDLEGLLSDIEFAKGLRDLVDGLEASGDALKAVEVAARDAARTQVKAITDFFDRASALGFQAEALSGRDSLVQQLLDFSAKPEAVSETAKALAALGATLKVVRENAEALGVTEAEIAAAETAAKEDLRKGFDEGIAQQILAIVDPVAAALAEFDKAAAQRLEEARLAGANLVEVERLNALQRQQVLEQAGAASRSSLLKFWEDITFGGLSGASPMASLEGTRASFLAAAAQGDRGRIEDLGRSLLERSRGAFASSAGFQSDLDLVRSIVEPLVLANDNAVVNAIYTSGGEQTRFLAQLVAVNGSQSEEIAAMKDEIARMNSLLQRLLVAA